MKKIVGVILLCVMLTCEPATSQAVIVWTDKGCDSTYKPGEIVQIHYRVFGTGWTRVFKQFPDTHEEELAGWRYFPGGGEYVEMDTLGPECGKIIYTVSFYEEFALGCPVCIPCPGCGPSVVYVMETGRQTCSITVQCDMKGSLFTDKTEYISGVDSEVEITFNITDVYENPLDVDSVVMDVNGIGVTAIKSSPGLYTGKFILSGRLQGEYKVIATAFKRGYPQLTKTATFTLTVPVDIILSLDRDTYTQNSQPAVRAEVKDPSGRGVTGLSLEVTYSDRKAALTDVGGGVYEAQLDLSGLEKGKYTVDITTDEKYIEVGQVLRAEFTVSGLPVLLVETSGVQVGIDSVKDFTVLIRNTGEGDAVNLSVSVMAPPGVDVRGVSGYTPVLPPGGQTTASISIMGREKGEYTLSVEVSYQDVGGGQGKAQGEVPVSVTSSMVLLIVAAIVGAVVVVGVGVYLLLRKAKGEKKEP